MSQLILQLEEREEKIIKKLMAKWNLPKYLTIKQLILEYDKLSAGAEY
jgi:hypothetical protein